MGRASRVAALVFVRTHSLHDFHSGDVGRQDLSPHALGSHHHEVMADLRLGLVRKEAGPRQPAPGGLDVAMAVG